MFHFYEELSDLDVDWESYNPFQDAQELWQHGSDFILSEGYQRSKETGVGILEPLPLGGILREIPFVSWVASFIPRIYVFSGSKENLQAVAEYGEHVKDPVAREPHERVRQATDATTIVNLVGDAAKQEKQKIRKNLSSTSAFQCAKELGASVADIWDEQLSLQDNLTYIGATLIGRSFLGIQNFPKEYVSLIRHANDLIADGNATSDEFADMKAQMVAMSDTILANEAEQILETKGYVCTQFELEGDESLEEATEKLKASNAGAGFLVESNLSFILMVALAHVSSSPDILERLREEIQSFEDEPSILSVRKLEYLDCIYRETIRFASPTAVVPRRASVKSNIDIVNSNQDKSTCSIYPNSFIFFAIRATHHDGGLYKDAHLFNPLRFMSAVKARETHFVGDQYYPFSGGTRACPAGTMFVENAFKGFLFEFFKTHSLELDKPLENIPACAIHPRWKQEYFAQLQTHAGNMLMPVKM